MDENKPPIEDADVVEKLRWAADKFKESDAAEKVRLAVGEAAKVVKDIVDELK